MMLEHLAMEYEGQVKSTRAAAADPPPQEAQAQGPPEALAQRHIVL